MKINQKGNKNKKKLSPISMILQIFGTLKVVQMPRKLSTGTSMLEALSQQFMV